MLGHRLTGCVCACGEGCQSASYRYGTKHGATAYQGFVYRAGTLPFSILGQIDQGISLDRLDSLSRICRFTFRFTIVKQAYVQEKAGLNTAVFVQN